MTSQARHRSPAPPSSRRRRGATEPARQRGSAEPAGRRDFTERTEGAGRRAAPTERHGRSRPRGRAIPGRWWLLARRALALACLTAAVALTVTLLRPPPPATVPVLTAAVDLPAGQALTDAHLAVRRIPASAVAPGALKDPADAVGHAVVAATPAGTQLTATTVLGPGLLAAAPEGTVVVAVPLAGSWEAVLAEPGRTVTLFAAPRSGAVGPAEEVGRGVVLATIDTSSQVSSLLAEVNGPESPTTYVAVPRDLARVVVAAGATGTLTVVVGR